MLRVMVIKVGEDKGLEVGIKKDSNSNKDGNRDKIR